MADIFILALMCQKITCIKYSVPVNGGKKVQNIVVCVVFNLGIEVGEGGRGC